MKPYVSDVWMWEIIAVLADIIKIKIMNPKSKKIYYYIVGTIFSLIAIVIVYQFIVAMSESEGPVFETKKEYLELFNSDTRKQFVTGASYNTNVRNSIATLDYDKGKYSLIIYQIPVVKNFELNKVLVAMESNEDYSSGSVYSTINQTFFEVYYVSGKPTLADEIHFFYGGGDSLKTIIKNDSINLFYLKYKNLAIRYNKEKTIDIYSRVGEPYPSVPVSILFLKRNDEVYFLMLSVKNPQEKLDPNLLYTMIK